MVAFPRPGEQFGRYLIERIVGEGGMGIVYQATDAQLHRAVALKIVQPSLAQGEEFRTRFEREASTLARLRSRHIVQILEYGEVEGTVYLVTEFVPDGDLHHRLSSRGPLEPLSSLKLLLPVCEALDDAHRAGVVHRDVKPSNVLLWERTPGELIPYLCDFGIATEGDSGATRTGTVIGSLAYMAPERHLGQLASPQGDVYSAGCVLWACLTGKPPYGGTDFQLMTAHLNNPVPQLPAAVTGAPVINPLLLRALAKDPSQRYPSAAAFASALDAAIDELEEGPRRPRYASMPPPSIPQTSPGPTRLPAGSAMPPRPAASQPAPSQSAPREAAPSQAAPESAPSEWAPTHVAGPRPGHLAPSQRPAAAQRPGPAMSPAGPPPPPPQAHPIGAPVGPAGVAPGRRGRSRRKLALVGGLVVVLLVGGGTGAWALLRGSGSDALKGDDKAVARLLTSQVGAPTWVDHATVACASDKLLHQTPARTLAAHDVVTKRPGSSTDAWTYNSRWPYADARRYAQNVLSCSDDWAGALANAWHLDTSSCLHDIGTKSMAGVVAATSLTLSDDAAAEVNGTKSKLDGCYATTPQAPRITASSAYRAVKFSLTRPQAANGTASLQVRSSGAWKTVSGTTYRADTPMGDRSKCLQAQVVVSYPWGTTKANASRACGTSEAPRLWWTKVKCTVEPGCREYELHAEGFKDYTFLHVTNLPGSDRFSCKDQCHEQLITDGNGRAHGNKWWFPSGLSGLWMAQIGKYSSNIPFG